jgi:hypothetical protein
MLLVPADSVNGRRNEVPLRSVRGGGLVDARTSGDSYVLGPVSLWEWNDALF